MFGIRKCKWVTFIDLFSCNFFFLFIDFCPISAKIKRKNNSFPIFWKQMECQNDILLMSVAHNVEHLSSIFLYLNYIWFTKYFHRLCANKTGTEETDLMKSCFCIFFFQHENWKTILFFFWNSKIDFYGYKNVVHL